jgi:hypothetical protein
MKDIFNNLVDFLRSRTDKNKNIKFLALEEEQKDKKEQPVQGNDCDYNVLKTANIVQDFLDKGLGDGVVIPYDGESATMNILKGKMNKYKQAGDIAGCKKIAVLMTGAAKFGLRSDYREYVLVADELARMYESIQILKREATGAVYGSSAMNKMLDASKKWIGIVPKELNMPEALQYIIDNKIYEQCDSTKEEIEEIGFYFAYQNYLLNNIKLANYFLDVCKVSTEDVKNYIDLEDMIVDKLERDKEYKFFGTKYERLSMKLHMKICTALDFISSSPNEQASEEMISAIDAITEKYFKDKTSVGLENEIKLHFNIQNTGQ